MKNFQDLFRHELQDVYSAETQWEKALREYEMAAHAAGLKEAFRANREETKRQIQRLEAAAKELNINLAGHECEALKTFVKEAQKVMKADYSQEVRDAALISSAQRIKHYEITLYGTLKAFARQLNYKAADRLFDEILKEEVSADKMLTEIAIGKAAGHGVNLEAVKRKAA